MDGPLCFSQPIYLTCHFSECFDNVIDGLRCRIAISLTTSFGLHPVAHNPSLRCGRCGRLSPLTPVPSYPERFFYPGDDVDKTEYKKLTHLI